MTTPRPVSQPDLKACPSCGGALDHEWWPVGDDSYACDRPVSQPAERARLTRHEGRCAICDYPVSIQHDDARQRVRDHMARVRLSGDDEGLRAALDAAFDRTRREHIGGPSWDSIDAAIGSALNSAQEYVRAALASGSAPAEPTCPTCGQPGWHLVLGHDTIPDHAWPE